MALSILGVNDSLGRDCDCLGRVLVKGKFEEYHLKRRIGDGVRAFGTKFDLPCFISVKFSQTTIPYINMKRDNQMFEKGG